jgi:putative tryptophan/tyrosine transport system substrate-binding protein
VTTYTRRQLVQGASVVGLGLLAGCGRLPWQTAPDARPAKTAQVGFLGRSYDDPARAGALRHGLEQYGYVDGQNLTLHLRYAEGMEERLPALAAELARLRVDVIVTSGPPATQAAKQTTSTIPIVMVVQGDPVANGLVSSLARPDGNVTGLTRNPSGLQTKQLELLKEMVPGTSRVAVLWNADNRFIVQQVGHVQTAAHALGIELESLKVHDPAEFDEAFEAAARQHVEGLIVLEDGLTLDHRRQIVELAAKHRLPAMYPTSVWTQIGGLLSYGPSIIDEYHRAAYYIDKILKGAKPADLPVEQPMRFEFVINLRTAQALGLTIPHHVLLQATEVLQ